MGLTPPVSLSGRGARPARRRRGAPLLSHHESLWVLAMSVIAFAAGALVAFTPLLALGLAGFAVATVTIASAPLFCLLAVLLIRPSLDRTEEFFNVAGVNLGGMMGVTLVVCGPAALLLARASLPARGVNRVIAAYAVLTFASLAWSFVSPAAAAPELVLWMTPFVVFALASWVVRDVATFRRVINVLLLSSVVPVLVGIVQLATGRGLNKEGFDSISGTFVHPNGYGLFLLAAGALGLVTLLEERDPRRRRVLVALLGLIAFALLNTYARSAWIGFGLVFVALALFTHRRLIVVALVGGALAIAAAPGLVTDVAGRFSDLSSSSASYGNNSLGWRLKHWTRMWPYATERPVTGHGVATYLPLSNQEIGIFDWEWQTPEEGPGNLEVYAHNDYLHILIELGVPGVVLWIAVLTAVGLAVWRKRHVPELRPYAVAIAALVAALAAASATDNVRTYIPVMIMAFGAAGALLGAAARTGDPAAGGPQPRGSTRTSATPGRV